MPFKVNLIKVTLEFIYKDSDGNILNNEKLSENQKLFHSLFNDVIPLKKEELIEEWRCKLKKQIDARFWDYMKENNITNPENYYVTIYKI